MEQQGRKFPNSLKKFRRIHGHTQRHVAKLLDHKTVTKLSNWENGNIQPSFNSILKLSIIYRTLPGELYPELYQKLRNSIGLKEQELFTPRIPDWN